jgi:hypothetical protein
MENMKTVKKLQILLPLLLMGMLLAACSPKAPTNVVSTTLPAIKPGVAGNVIRTLEDTNSSFKASEKRATTGDNYLRDLYERPFTSKTMVYQPDVDILTASIAKDDNFFYFKIKLAGLDTKTNSLTADYAIEFDLNKDGRGDYLVWVKSPAKDWSTEGLSLYADPNSDVGGNVPISADAGFKGDGYEKIVAAGADDSSFARISPDEPAVVEIAVNLKSLGNPTELLWGAWADAGLRDPQKFDYNDVFGPTEAGSPIKGNTDYPLKALYSVDNTCRVLYGFTTTSNIPGMCTSVQPKPQPQPQQPNIPGVPTQKPIA